MSDLRRVQYTDEVGRKWVTEVPAGWPESDAASGLPVGPASLEALKLPLEWELRLHNELVARNLLTYADVASRPQDVEAALRSVLRTGAREVQELFRTSSGAEALIRQRPR